MSATTSIEIVVQAIGNILNAMIKLANDAPCSADTHLAQAVALLNQLAHIETYDDPEMADTLEYCRMVVLGPTYTRQCINEPQA